MKDNIKSLVRTNILKMTSYSSARDEYKSNEGIFLDANESPYGDNNRYPDPYQKDLKALLSDHKGIEEEHIFVANGSDEAIDLLFRVFCRPGIDKSISFSPGYSMYEVSAAVQDIQHINLSLNARFQLNRDAILPYLSDTSIKLIFICSPNNPTGNIINRQDILWLLKNFKGITIIDEAYIDFTKCNSWLSEIKKYERLIILQTMSKALGLAGARVGMAYSNAYIISLLNKIKSPYNISALNQKAAIDILNSEKENNKRINDIILQRKVLEKELIKIKIIEKIYSSETNFILIKVKDANKIYNKLIQNKIIVRNQSNKIKNCLRITIGTSEENNHLLETLSAINEHL